MKIGDIVNIDLGEKKQILILNFDGERVHFQFTGTNKTDTLMLEDFEYLTGQTLEKPKTVAVELDDTGDVVEATNAADDFVDAVKELQQDLAKADLTKKPKILLVTDVYGWGGHERAKKIKQFLSDEFDFDIMNADDFSKFEEESNDCFVKWKRLANIVEGGKWTKQYVNVKELIENELQPQVKRDYDLYYLMFHTMLPWQQCKRIMFGGIKNKPGKFITVVTGMPVVKEVFGQDKEYGNNPITAFTELTKKCEAMAANNKISLRDLKSVYKGPSYYIPRGVDPKVFYPQGYKWENSTEEVGNNKTYHSFVNMTCAFVGKAHSGKGLERFIRPACQNAGVNIIVNERNYTDALPKDKMREFYNKAHVYVVASVTDGTPNPALEAAACGRPIISNRIGNMPEFIKDGYNGFLVDRNVDQIKEKLLWLKQNPKKAKEMGQNARKTVLEGWTWEHAMEREREMLREILK